MIAAWMAYCLGITTLLAAGAFALDRALRLGRRPTRWVWTGALAASLAIPLAARIRPEAFTTVTVPTLATAPIQINVTRDAVPPTATPPVAPSRSFSLSDLDRPLVWLWVGMSAILCIMLIVAAWRLARLRRQWLRASLEGRAVLVSDDVGPAVASFWSRDLVFPLWTLTLDDRQRRLMLAHEEEHVRARDPWLLAAAGLALVAVPWNVAAWWLVRRLRLAVEMDCDARVLGRGQDVASYGALLLAVGGRATRRLIGAAALGEPASFLEHRIRSMTAAVPRRYVRQAAGLVALAAGALVLACEAPRPEQPQLTDNPNRSSRTPTGLGSGWVTGKGGVHVGATLPTLEEVQHSVLENYGAEVQRYAGAATDLWFVVDPQGTVVSHGAASASAPDSIDTEEARRLVPGYDTLRVAMITLLGPGKLAPHSPAVMWVQLRAPSSPARDIESDIDASMTALLRPEIRSGLQAYYPPLIGQTSGPALDVWLGHDAQGRVIRAAQTPSSGRPMNSDQIRGALAEFRPGRDAWELVDRAALRGMVRDNVRVVWVYVEEGGRTATSFNPSSEYLHAAALRFEPEAFRDARPDASIALVFDAQDTVVGHNAGVRLASDRDCTAVVERLLPQFTRPKYASSGCAILAPSKVVVYWSSLRP